MSDGAKNWLDRVLSYLSNGFVLLLIGAGITSFLVPLYQAARDAEERRTTLMNESFSQFLLYANSIWEEYYLMFPLIQESTIDKTQYNEYLLKIGNVKLKRYDAYARVKSLAIAFRGEKERTDVEEAVRAYAVDVNGVSAKIDAWLRGLYCFPKQCFSTEGVGTDLDFNSYNAFRDVAQSMQTLEAAAEKVSTLMGSRMKEGGGG